MIEGTIRKDGKIIGNDGKTYKISQATRRTIGSASLTPGRQVCFDENGGWATNVQFLETPKEEIPAVQSKPAPLPSTPKLPSLMPSLSVNSALPFSLNQQTTPDFSNPASLGATATHSRSFVESYRFLNPYNFVRFLEKPRPSGQVLGNCPPPPHDRYVGLTGYITCQLTNITPLFISDSHAINGKAGEHRTFRFFRDPEGKIALPGTSLRGMLRSVFEAATNSCFGVFGGERLSEHINVQEALTLVPGRIEATENGWILHLLTGTTPLQVGNPPARGDKQYAAWMHRYWPMQPSKTLVRQSPPPLNQKTRDFRERTRKGTEVNLQNLRHGQACYALLRPREHPHPNIKFWDVVEVSNNAEQLNRKCQRAERVAFGWICLTNQNIEIKHSERFFFRADDNNHGPQSIPLTEEVLRVYEDLIKDYQDRHAKEVEKRQRLQQPLGKPVSPQDAGLSRFIYEESERKVRGGELVYAMLEGSIEEPCVRFIVPVLIPRVAYKSSIADLISKDQYAHVRHCTNENGNNLLCPACRVFGWVHQDAKKMNIDERVAYAGRVRISDATLTGTGVAKTMPELTLAILSTPKPTKAQFYLLDHAGRPDINVDYNTHGARIRGRKFYRHHGNQPSRHDNGFEYERAVDTDHDGKDDQNRTVRGVLEPDAVFTFTVNFENLAPEELGALLWSLELEEGMHHRLGYAKSLGFGSLRIKITELQLLQPEHRYDSLSKSGWQDVIAKKEIWKKQFKDQIVAMYTRNGVFEDLPNIQDLKTLTSQPDLVHIHYPRKQPDPDPEGKNFEWFRDNPQQVLGLANTDEGLTTE